MKFKSSRFEACRRLVWSLVAIVCSVLMAPGDGVWAVSSGQNAPAGQASAMLSPQELDSLVAPIALYPDELLSQALVASTYPLEIVQLQQ